MSSIDNNLGGGGGSASASGKKGAIQLSDGNFNLTSNKELKSDPKTGTITTTGLTTTGTVYAATLSTSNLIADTITELTVIGDASITGDATVDGFVQAATISSTGNAYISSNLGIGTTDTAEYKFLVKDGSSNLFGVPYDTTGLADGKTIVYNGSGWVYDNAGPADGTQTGEILAWDGSEWSANSTVVVEGTSVGIGTTQPTQKLDVAGNVKATYFIGSGDALSNLNASNVTSGTLSNARLPGTISVSNLEATANLVVGGSADITGTLSVAGLTSSENITVTGNNTLSAFNLRTSNLYITGPADITGTLSASSITTSDLLINGTLTTGNVETTNVIATYLVQGATISSTDSLKGASATVLGQVQGSTISSTGHIIADGTVTGTTVNTPTLFVSKDAQINGNLYVSGGVVTITTTTTGTSNLVITNAGTGPVLVATQLGPQPIANFIDGRDDGSNSNVSVLFISGGELAGRDGYVGLGTETPTHRLDVRGDANVATNLFVHGTLSTSNVETSNLTVTNLNTVTNDAFIGGTLSASNIQTSNLTVTNSHEVIGTLSASNIETSNLTVNGNTYISSNLGVGTSDTAEYKLLVKDGSSNLFGVPYDTTGLADGKTIVYDGSGWVYDNAGPADGTQTGEILAWDGSEWSANSAVVVEGTNVGIGSTQPVEKLNVSGNVRVTQNMIIGDSYHGRAMRLNDTPASNLYYQPNLTITGSLTSAGDIKTNQSFRGHNMFLSNAMTISGGVVTNTGTGDASVNGSLTVQGDTVLNGTTSAAQLNVAGTITTSNIVAHTNENLLISSNLEVGTSNLFVNTENGNVGIGTTDPVATLQVVGDIKCQTLTATTITGGSPLTISATSISIQAPVSMPANVPMSIGTMTVSNIFHSDTVTMSANVAMGSDKTLTTSNIETSNLTVSNRLSGGTISVSNIEATANLVVGGPVDITGTLSSAGITSSADVNVTGTITTSQIVAHANENLLISSNLEVGTSNLFVNTANGRVGIGITEPTEKLHVDGNILATGTLSVNPNTDSKHTLGNAVVGYQGTYTGFAGLCHYDRQGVGNYAIMQNSSGRTLVNASTDQPIEFRINNITKMILESDGKVGIGTTEPESNLHSFSRMNSGMGTILYTQRADNSAYYSFFKQRAIDFSTDPIFHFKTREYLENASNTYSTFRVEGAQGTSFLEIEQNGNVGIGTDIPDVPLHIVDRSSIGTPSEVLRLQKGNGSGDIYNTTRGHIGMHLRDNNLGGGEVARISWGHDGGSMDPEGLGRLGFWTSNTGDAEGVPEERMTIRASGNVGIGVESPTAQLQVNSNVIIGNIGVDGSQTTHKDAQLILGGSHNQEYNNDDKIKLLVTGGNNDNGSPYYIMCEDEDGFDQFFVKGATSENGTNGILYFKGNVGIGITNPDAILHVIGPQSSTGDKLRLGDGTTSLDFTIGFKAGGSGYLSGWSTIDPNGGSGVPGSGVAIWDALHIHGNLNVTASKNFIIDHPVHPTTKKLVHVSVESPRVDLIYRGSIQLENGTAIVNIDRDCTGEKTCAMEDGTFEALCRDPVYYLQNTTDFSRVIGTINNNLLTIISEDTNSTSVINWMVVAERKDRDILESSQTDDNGRLMTEILDDTERINKDRSKRYQ